MHQNKYKNPYSPVIIDMKNMIGKISLPLVILVIVVLAIVAGGIAVWRLDTTGKTGSKLGPEFSYDLNNYRVIDPCLIKYQEVKQFATGLNNPRALTVGQVPEEAIYIAGDNLIVKYTPEGKILSEIKLAQPPYCLTLNSEGKIFVGLIDHIQVFSPQGKLLAKWKSPGPDAYLTALAVSKDLLFAADAGQRIIHQYDITGKFIKNIGSKNPQRNIPGFVLPSPYFDIAVAPDGLLRVTNPGRHLIEAYTFDGDREFSWGKASMAIEGFCGCCNPIHFALIPDGSFVTSEKGITRIKVYDPEGKFVSVVAGPDQFVEHDRIFNETRSNRELGGLDVAVDSKSRILTLDACTSQVRIFAPKDKPK